MTVIELVLALAAILGAAILFTNAVEILGERLNLGQGAVGSVLAAVGTALPETMIPLVAILGAVIAGSNDSAAGEIGIGAILGAPFLLSTLALFIVGVSAFAFSGRRSSGTEVTVDMKTARLDMLFFFFCFALAAGAGLVSLPTVLRVLLGIGLLGAYVVYVVITVRSGGGGAVEDAPDKLTLWPGSSMAPTWAVVAQLVLMVVVMGAGAHYFVSAVERAASAIGAPAGLISLVLAPLATELPEKFNSIIWMRDNKDTLALGNISGAMVFQSTIPVTIGILFTPWQFGFLSAFSAALALLSGLVFIGFLFRRKPLHAFPLLGAGSLYILFVVVAFITIF